MRVKYADEMGGEGQMDLTRVRPGDLVRFEGAFRKVGDDEEGAGAALEVDDGETGEVVEIGQGHLQVSVPGRRHHGNVSRQETLTLEVEPAAVCVLVNSADGRIGNHRSGFRKVLAMVSRTGAWIFDRGVVRMELRRRLRGLTKDASRDMSPDVTYTAKLTQLTDDRSWRALVKAAGVRWTEEERQSPNWFYDIDYNSMVWAAKVEGADIRKREKVLDALKSLREEQERFLEYQEGIAGETRDEYDLADLEDLETDITRLRKAEEQLEELTDAQWTKVHEWQEEFRKDLEEIRPYTEGSTPVEPVREPEEGVTTDQTYRVPIKWQGTRFWVWAQPRMLVRSTGGETHGPVTIGDAIVEGYSTEEPGSLVVIDGTGQTQVWDVIEDGVVLSPSWNGPFPKAAPYHVKKFKEEHARRVKERVEDSLAVS